MPPFVKLLNRTPWTCNSLKCNFKLGLISVDRSMSTYQSGVRTVVNLKINFLMLFNEFQWIFWKSNKTAMNFIEWKFKYPEITFYCWHSNRLARFLLLPSPNWPTATVLLLAMIAWQLFFSSLKCLSNVKSDLIYQNNGSNRNSF